MGKSFSTPCFDFNFVSHLRNDVHSSYIKEGIIHLKGVLSSAELAGVHQELFVAEQRAESELKEFWNNEKVYFYSKNPSFEKESERKKVDFVSSFYFRQSYNKTCIFYENINGQTHLNRLGHGLHLFEEYEYFNRFIYRNKHLKFYLEQVGLIHPICLLSAYIPKLPKKIGSQVFPHQESTFANTSPTSCVVLWLALEDATIENACMWGLPRSHLLPLKYVSHVDHQTGVRKMVKINNVDIPAFAAVEGEEYCPLEVKAGDALMFHGNYVHCSPTNLSSKSRKAITFQFVDTHETKISSFNWINNPNNRVIY